MSFNTEGLVVKIPVIIPMFGNSELTDKCIEFTKKNAGVDIDIIVVDDGTPIPYKNSEVEVLRLDVNSGFTNATNKGILHGLRRNPDAKYVHMLNNDTEPEPNFIKHLYDIMEKYDEIAVAISTKIVKKDPLLVENEAIDLMFGWHCFTEYHFPDEIRNIVWAGLTSALLRVSVLQEIGLLDKRMRNYCSDNEYCYRCISHGYKVVLIPKSSIYHQKESTTRKAGVTTGGDQKVLFDKISGVYMQKVLDMLPLDHNPDEKKQSWGRLHLEIYEK